MTILKGLMECGCSSAVLAARHSGEVDEGSFDKALLSFPSESEALGKVKGPHSVQHEWSPDWECSLSPQQIDWMAQKGPRQHSSPEFFLLCWETLNKSWLRALSVRRLPHKHEKTCVQLSST